MSSSNRSPPTLVYRGDGRPPSEIFKDGFTSRGQDDDLIAHVAGGSQNLLKTGYISTSQSLRTPPLFMQVVTIKDPKTGREMLDEYRGKDNQIYTYRRGWVYHIKPTNLEMYYVPDELKGDTPDIKALRANNLFQQEWAVKLKVPGKNIKLAQRVEGYIRKQDNFFDGKGTFPISPPEKPDPFTKDVQNNPDYAYN